MSNHERKTGVYQIWLGDYYYFGSAEDCDDRCLKEHLSALKCGTHRNKKMQNVFDKYQTFEYQIVVECDDRDTAYAWEQGFIDTHIGLQKCLNLNASAAKPPGFAGKKHSEETKLLISVGGKGKVRTDETKAAMSKSKKGVARQKDVCKYCGTVAMKSNITRWHNDNCKYKGDN